MLATAAVLAALLAGGAGTAAAASAEDSRVVIAVLPYATTVEQIAAVPELAPGVVSAGLGAVPVAQTFLDIGQGNRVNESLYDGDLPRLYVRDGRVPERLWERTLARAESAPANIIPGLLASTLADAGVPVGAEDASGSATLIAVDRDGAVRIADAQACAAGCGPGLSAASGRGCGELETLVGELGPGDLLIAFASGSEAQQELLPVGIAGEGFDGNLTSASTRTDGVVVSTDIAPTVLEHLGVEVPDEVNGSEITSADERDPAHVADLQARLDHRPSRDAVVLLPLGIWLLLAALAALAWRGRGAARRRCDCWRSRSPGRRRSCSPLAAPDAGPLASALAVGARGAAARAARPIGCCARLRRAGARLRGHRRRLRGRRDRRLAADRALGARPEPGRRSAVLRHRQRARGDPHHPDPGRHRRLARAAPRSSSRDERPPGSSPSASPPPRPSRPGRFGADVGAAIVLGVGAATAAVLALGLERRRAIAVVAGGGLRRWRRCSPSTSSSVAPT